MTKMPALATLTRRTLAVALATLCLAPQMSLAGSLAALPGT